MLTSNNVRGEHMLWLTPVIYIWATGITQSTQTFVVLQDGSFHIFNFFTTLIIFLAAIAIPYLLHKHFRETNSRSIVISWLHILASSGLTLAILLIYTYAAPIDRDWLSYPLLRPNFYRWQFLNDVAIVLFQIFLFIQAAYIVYGLSKIAQQKMKGAYRQDLELYDYNNQQPMVNPAL